MYRAHPGPLWLQEMPPAWPSFPLRNTDHGYLVLGVPAVLLPLKVVFEEDQILQAGIQGPLYSWHSANADPHFGNFPRLHFPAHKSLCPNCAPPAPTQGPGEWVDSEIQDILARAALGTAMKESPEAKAEGSGYSGEII